MCGRFALTLPPEAVAGWFSASLEKSQDFQARYNICPTQEISTVVHFKGDRFIVPMRWGFVPLWYTTLSDGPLIINARRETIAEKPAFREAVKSRRCLVPATGFYEWHREKGKGKEPWFLKPARMELMAFAAVWQVWKTQENQRFVTCAMVTTDAGPELSAIHHREPVVVQPKDYGLWLGEEGKGAGGLLAAVESGFYEKYRVSPKVNGAQYDAPELIEPIVGLPE